MDESMMSACTWVCMCVFQRACANARLCLRLPLPLKVGSGLISSVASAAVGALVPKFKKNDPRT